MRAQSGFVMVFLLILVIGFMVLFLVSISSVVKNTEYTQLYTTNFLLSILKSDTGFTDPNCKLVSDALYCSFTSSEYLCGSSGKTCGDVAKEAVDTYLDYDTGIAKKSFRHLLIAEPESPWYPVSGGIPIKFEVGDTSIQDLRSKKTVQNEILGSGSRLLNVRLFVVDS